MFMVVQFSVLMKQHFSVASSLRICKQLAFHVVQVGNMYIASN